MAVKYVFVTGGVVSGLGKGFSRKTSEIPRLLCHHAEIRSIPEY